MTGVSVIDFCGYDLGFRLDAIIHVMHRVSADKVYHMLQMLIIIMKCD